MSSTRLRKSSHSIALTTLSALSLTLAATACKPETAAPEPTTPPVTADCVVVESDGSYRPVDDDRCDDSDSGSGFVWIYGGTYHPHTGRISGGTRSKPAGTNISTRSGKVIVGGFGSSGKGGSGS
ncbi:hypothetical protein GCM10010156_49270 [Planobispora rosea]|uniref:Lipoprotein n=1 Tax=Planobispora rosea TaxID=35762 RepID=A0A8J3S3G5_PLARO|nr:hypothetical protein [Planobispora rosea]GGS84790.1 hypothetical protein GCM10010156_49270 [Planobispora rosea]GIH86438.1 hypothetical protein Pro02_48460 [Planobispora rosea]